LNAVLLSIAFVLAVGILFLRYAGRPPLELFNERTLAASPPATWRGQPALWDPPAIEHATISYFDVSGRTQGALKRSLNDSPIAHEPPDPTAPGRGVAWGLITFTPSGGECSSPAAVTLSYTLVVTLPRWAPPSDGSVTVDLVDKWNALLRVIHTHEAGHASIYRDDMAAIQDHARALSDCDAVVAYLDDPATFKKIDDDQAAYHKRVYGNCRPETGCAPPGWMGW
jgi:predicted secreted Zn-dependent protease